MSVINTNISATIAQNSLVKTNREMQTAMQQLSTGSRINSAKDDAAGLAISSKMTAQINGLNQAVRNANDGISLIQTAEGALVEVTNMLQRMRELAVQSASDSNTESDRAALNAEFTALRDEINRIGNNTQFNSINILDKSFDGGSGTFTFQVGANSAQTISMSMDDFRTTGSTSSGSVTQTSSTSGNEQVNTVTFAETTEADDAMAAGDTIKFSLDDGRDYVFTASEDLASPAAIASAIIGDTNFGELLGITPTAGATSDSVKFTGASGESYVLTTDFTGASNVAAATVSASTYTPSVQTTTLTLGGTYAEGDTIEIDLGGGNTYTHTVAAGATSANDIATAIAADTDADSGLGLTVAAGVAGKVTLTGAPNQSFTASVRVNGSTGGDLAMINASSITTRGNADSAVTALDQAIQVVSDGRAEMGAVINRLTYAADNLLNTSQNASEARSRVLDTDFAATTTELARTQIIAQAGTAMLAQANQQPQSVLALLQ